MVRKNNPVNPGSDFFSAATDERVQCTKISIIVLHVIIKIMVQDFSREVQRTFGGFFFRLILQDGGDF
jgi:hypothetical protein